MANDGSMVAKLEQYIADTLAALVSDDKDIFRTAEVWRHQIHAVAGGTEAIDRYAPFAFASYNGADAVREGSADLRQQLLFSILVGQISRQEGHCRFGDTSLLGTAKLRELVIAALDRQHPGEGFACDSFYYEGEYEIVDQPKRHVIQMNFSINWLS